MKNIYLLALLPLFLASCNSRNSAIPLSKIDTERKQIAQNFAETFLKKCAEEDYSAFQNFKISRGFERQLISDSLQKYCQAIVRRNGKVTFEGLVSVDTRNSTKDFLDVFNFKLKTEKSAAPVYLHLGMYRDQNYVEKPLNFSADEHYYETIRKKYYKK